MAGSYPNVPGNRMALDVDGSVFVKIDASNNATTLGSVDSGYLNDETTSSVTIAGANSSGQIVLIFPELRDIVGIFCQAVYIDANGSPTWQGFESSTNTTNGIDGTWTSVSGVAARMYKTYPTPTAVSPAYRGSISSVSLSGIKGLRVRIASGFYSPSYVQAFHVYGTYSSSSDRLEFWADDQSARVAPAFFDFGNTPRLSSTVKTFKIKNLSATKTANSITVSDQALTDIGGMDTSFTFSTDGVSYADSINIGNISPGGYSNTLYVRYAPALTDTLGLGAIRFVATPTSWT